MLVDTARVGGSGSTHIAVCRCHTDSAYQKHPVDPGDVDLLMKDLRSMYDFDLREIRESNDLGEQLSYTSAFLQTLSTNRIHHLT